MIYGSACSGIEAASVAWHPLGWNAAFVAEIDAFPAAVLAERWPAVPNLGDFTKIGDGHAIDLLVGGTPCQSFSVAGRRAGLDDPRGNLTLEFLALAGRLRPRWLLWENVPGVLSDDGGRTFGTVLGLLGQLGYGFAYRILDAQFFGVPQRRRRVFVVGCLGDWRRAAAVLFERACLRGDPSPSREAGSRPSHAPTSRAGGERYEAEGDYVMSSTLGADSGRSQIERAYVTHALKAEGFDASEDGTGRGVPLVADPISANEGRTYSNAGNNPRLHNVIATFDPTQVTSRQNRSRCTPTPTPTLGETTHPPAIAFQSTVRRLTPRECERLQGFPDDYTLIPYRGKAACDGPRYRALGNSMAVPVMRWIGERIEVLR